MAGAAAPSRRVDTVSWGLFFIWIGFALLMDIGWGWWLLGISAIILGAQVALYVSGDKVDRFWVACGLLFLAGGFWELFGLTWPLAPVLLVLLGVIMVGSALFRAG